MAPFTAALIDKYGFKSVVLVALALIEIGLLGALVMTKLWHLVLFWGVIVGLGTGLTAMVLGALVATRWFTARRGLAVGILSASSASGQLLLLPLAAWLADRYGWRVALAPPIVALLVVALVVVLFLVDKPEDVGLKPYGDTGDTPAHVAPPAAFGRAFEILFEFDPQRGILGAGGHVLRLRAQHQWSGSDPFHCVLRRLRHAGGGGGVDCWR